MRISISNIAWDISEDGCVASILKKYKVDAIDIAPGKYFPNPLFTKEEDVLAVKNYWEGHGIKLTGMQSLLFGTVGLNVFGSDASQKAMLDHLSAICNIAHGLGVTQIVFGSPKNRDRTGLGDEEALRQAKRFFRCLGDLGQAQNITICLEPNPTYYGANFMTTSIETLNVVKAIGHPAVKMQLDLGAISINNEDIFDVLKVAKSYIGHVHISEPSLAVIGDCDTNHEVYSKAIYDILGNDFLVCIEMIATKDEPHIESIDRALSFVTAAYRDKI